MAKRKVGKPLKFPSVKGLQKQIDQYFESCWQEIKSTTKAGVTTVKFKQYKPYTIAGLACFLDTTRETLLDYQNLESRKEYSYAIKKAKAKVHAYAEEHSFGQHPAGAIFSLKCNFGHQETQKLEVEGNINIKLVKFKDNGNNDS